MSRTGYANLPHLAARVFGTPHMIARRNLDAILSALAPRLGVVAPLAAEAPTPDGRKRAEVTKDGEIAVVQVIGPMVQRAGAIDAMCGDVTSYESLTAEIGSALADGNVKGILLELDSPGGEVAGLFGLVSRIASSSKPVFAVANEAAYSAAYALACACEQVFVGATAGVGSVGVVALHVDQSGQDSKDGRKFTYVHAGAKKVDGNPHEPLSTRAQAEIQGEVDALYDVFVKTVADNRGMTLKAVRATEAGTFLGKAAVDEGLADEVGTLEDAKAALRAEINRRSAKMSLSKVATKLALATDASEEQILAKIDESASVHAATLARADAAEKDLEKSEAASALLAAEVEKLQVETSAKNADHAIELAKTRALEAGLPPIEKQVEDDARELFKIGKADLARRSLDRHVEASRASRAALLDPKARVQRDESPKTLSSKESVLAKAKEEAAKLVAATPSTTKRGKAAK